MTVNYSEGGTSNNGRIIQIVQNRDTARRKWTDLAASTWANTYSNIDTTITPKLASSKLMFFINLNYGIGDDGGAASVFWQVRTGTSTVDVDLNGATSSGYQCFYQRRWSDSTDQMQYYMDQANMTGLTIDASNTSARTYKLYVRIQDSGHDLTINRDGSDNSDSSFGVHSPVACSAFTILEYSDV